MYKSLFLAVAVMLMFCSCRPAVSEQQIRSKVARLGSTDTNIVEEIGSLHAAPRAAAGYLLAELMPIGEYEKNGYHMAAENPSAYHVVACIIALQSITGKVFTAPAEKNGEFLMKKFLGERKEYPFYCIWMSRDCVYTAPAEVQEDVIRQWKEYITKNPGFEVKKFDPKDFDSWYFPDKY